MAASNYQLVREFFKAIASGELPDELLTQDMTFWSVNSGTSDRARFCGGIRILVSVFAEGPVYDIDALTAEEDRVVAEVRSSGVLVNGEAIQNTHVFIFRIREGRISSVAEFMDQLLVREKLVPLMQAALAGTGGPSRD